MQTYASGIFPRDRFTSGTFRSPSFPSNADQGYVNYVCFVVLIDLISGVWDFLKIKGVNWETKTLRMIKFEQCENNEKGKKLNEKRSAADVNDVVQNLYCNTNLSLEGQ